MRDHSKYDFYPDKSPFGNQHFKKIHRFYEVLIFEFCIKISLQNILTSYIHDGIAYFRYYTIQVSITSGPKARLNVISTYISNFNDYSRFYL